MSLFLKWKITGFCIIFYLTGFVMLALTPTAGNLLPVLYLAELANEALENEEGMPERGHFLLMYSYKGESIEPSVSVTRNGNSIASLSQLSAASSDTLVNLQTDKGDQINFSIEFGEDNATAYLHNSLASFETGILGQSVQY